MLRSKRSRLTALAVVLLLLLAGGLVALLHGGKEKPSAKDLLSGPVDVVGCAHPETVQVAVRTLAQSKRGPLRTGAGPVRPSPTRATPSATPSPTPSLTPSPTPSATSSPTASPTPTPYPTRTVPTRTPPPTVFPVPSSTNGFVAQGAAAPKTVPTAIVSNGRFHLTGLVPGTLYQLGAKVPGCAGAKVVVPHLGLFVAGKSQAPPLAVVKPPAVTAVGTKITYDAGPGVTKAGWTLSVGGTPQTCTTPKDVVASGDLGSGKGTFTVDPRPLGTKASGFTGSLHLTVTPKGGACAPSRDTAVPLIVEGLPQDGITQLQVYDAPELQTGGYGHCDVCEPGLYDPLLWKGSSAFDWDDSREDTRPFHWSSTAAGTTDGRWELSSSVLPYACAPSGVLASGSTGFKEGPLSDQSFSDPPNFTVDFSGRGLDHDTTYYLRVVPVNDKGACTGLPSPSIQLTYKKRPPNPSLPVPNPAPEFAHVTASVTSFQKLTGASDTPPYCFVALKDHDVSSDPFQITADVVGFVTVGPGGHVGKDQQVCYAPTDSGGSFWDDLTDVVDFVLDVVSYPSKVYELYQQIIPSILGELIPGCGDSCKGYLLLAEKAGLAAVGLPPSLPDASKLVNNGEDYLVQQASEATGVPETAVRAAYDKGKAAMVDQLAAVSSNQTGLTCDWCAFDNGVRAPSAQVVVTRPAGDDASLPLPHRVCLGNPLAVLTSKAPDYLADPLYRGSCADLPKAFPPGSTLSLPMSLSPNLDQIHQKVVNDWYASKSALGGGEDQLNRITFQTWLGQQQHTPLLSLTASVYGSYDAGPSFGTRDATVATTTWFFPE